jgi:hypothetical protein
VRHAGAGARKQVDAFVVQLDAVRVPGVGTGPAQVLRVFSGRAVELFARVGMSLSFSARWVCSDTPYSRASNAASRISSRLTENGEHGATTMRRMA